MESKEANPPTLSEWQVIISKHPLDILAKIVHSLTFCVECEYFPFLRTNIDAPQCETGVFSPVWVFALGPIYIEFQGRFQRVLSLDHRFTPSCIIHLVEAVSPLCKKYSILLGWSN